jgi:predicted TIM-barrel fold metal-dependent hydrolase
MIVDADGHVAIPEEMFQSRLPAKLQDRRPKLILMEDTKYFWLVEGRLIPKPAGRGAGTPRGFGGPLAWTTRRENRQGDRGHHIPQDHYLDNIQGRLEDLDMEGIQIQVLYPDLVMVDPEIADWELAAGMASAYNDHVGERCSLSPKRLKRVAVVALQNAREAASELRRCITELGCVGVVIPPFIEGRLLHHHDFEPFFEEANRLSASVAIHAVTGVYPMPWQNLFNDNFGAHMVAMPMAYMIAMTSLFDGNMLERYPNLKFAFLEAGCGWAPYWVQRLDEHLKTHRKLAYPASYHVSEGRLFFGCEPDEPELPYVISKLGPGCLLYSSDYPHGNAKWPNTVKMMRQTEGISDEAKQKILGLNALKFYGLESH